MLIVNVGRQGMNKRRDDGRGGIIETKSFPPNVPVECSDEMAAGLLKKYNNPTMAIYFLPEQDALQMGRAPEELTESAGLTSAELEEQAMSAGKPFPGYPGPQPENKAKRGRPKGAKNK